MSKNLFVIGTNTDIGKTYISALLVKKLREMGKNASYFKPVVSGNDIIDGKIVAGDALHVKTVAHLDCPANDMASYIFKNAYSPHLASEFEHNKIKLEKIKKDFCTHSIKHDFLTIEGAGGIFCPITRNLWLYDIIKMLDVPTVLVSNSGLGAINSCMLTCEFLAQKEIKLNGIILNNFEKDDIIHLDNKKMIDENCTARVIATVSKNDESIDIKGIEALYE